MRQKGRMFTTGNSLSGAAWEEKGRRSTRHQLPKYTPVSDVDLTFLRPRQQSNRAAPGANANRRQLRSFARAGLSFCSSFNLPGVRGWNEGRVTIGAENSAYHRSRSERLNGRHIVKSGLHT